MSDVVTSISRLVKSARRLRDVADELGQPDLKSQIVDEISTLQEIRDEMTGDSSDDVNSQEATESPADEHPSLTSLPSAGGIGIVEPTGKEETYSFSAEEEALEADSAESDDAVKDSATNTPKGPTPDGQRAAIEMRITDLEQLEQIANRRLNAVPTPEQKKIKAKASHAGRDAGKTGKELQQFVYGSMKLTPEQKTEIQSIRKDLHSIRDAIEKERDSLWNL